MENSRNFRSALNLNDKNHERNFPDKLLYRNEPFSWSDEVEKPRDLREKLNKNRYETTDRNNVKTVKASEDRWSHDLFDEQKQAPKSKEELKESYGYDLRDEKVKDEFVKTRKLRPERRLNLNDAIKFSLGLTQRPRKEIQEVQKPQDSKSSKVETELKKIEKLHKTIDQKPVKRDLNSRLKQFSVKPEETLPEINKEREKKLTISPEIHQEIFKRHGISVQRTTKLNSFESKNEDKKLKKPQNNFKSIEQKPVKRDLNSRLKQFSVKPEENLPEVNNETEKKLEIKPEIHQKIIKRYEISADASEFIPSSRQAVHQEVSKPEDIPTQADQEYFVYDELEQFPIEMFPIMPIAPSKLQNRLDRISKPTSNDRLPIEKTSTTFCFQPQKIEKSSSTAKVETSIRPKIETVYIPALPSNLTQSELDLIATESLAKLTEDQQTHLMYIANVPTKYFQEVFENFVDYFIDVQCVYLDLNAVHSYLLSQRIAVEEIKPPTPFQYENFSFVRKEDVEVQRQREKNPVTIVNPSEDEKIVLRMLEELEMENVIDNLFLPRI